jgi:hypothetical protein
MTPLLVLPKGDRRADGGNGKRETEDTDGGRQKKEDADRELVRSILSRPYLMLWEGQGRNRTNLTAAEVT